MTCRRREDSMPRTKRNIGQEILEGVRELKGKVSRADASRPDAENPEWTEEDFHRARPLLEVLPPEVVRAIRAKRTASGSTSRTRRQRPGGGSKARKRR